MLEDIFKILRKIEVDRKAKKIVQVIMKNSAQKKYLLKHLLSKSHYGNKIVIDMNLLLEIATYNHQINHALSRILSHSEFSKTTKIDKRQFYRELEIMQDFFEYLYYSSENFVRTAAYGKQKTL